MDDGSNAAGQTPLARGTLAERPLSHLLVYTRARRLTGRLLLRAEGGRGGVLSFCRGQIAGVSTAPPVAYFGSVALELGFVAATNVDATLREALATRRLHGEILIEHRLLSAAQRDAALAEQKRLRVGHLFGLPVAATFAFYEDIPSATEPSLTLDPVAAVWRAIRNGSLAPALADVVAPFMTTPLRLVNEAPIARAEFSAQEVALCEALATTAMTTAQMRSGFPGIAADQIDRIVYLLLITRSAEPAVAAVTAPDTGSRRSGPMDATAIAAALKKSLRPTGAPPAVAATVPQRNSVAPSFPSGTVVRTVQSSIPPRRVSGSFASSVAPPPSRVPSATRSAAEPLTASPAAAAPPLALASPAELGASGITLRAQTVENEEPFETLGVAADAPVDAARAAYFRLVRIWHPDRLPADLAVVRSDVGKVFAQITQAHQTLTDADARRSYLGARAERAAIIASRPRKDVVRRIDMAVTKKDFPFAAEETDKLIARDPQDDEAHALLAWITASAGEGPESTLRVALHALDRAINRDSHCARAVFYRGMIYKRLGNLEAAHRDFSRTVLLQPTHVDATREVRLYEMRMKKK